VNALARAALALLVIGGAASPAAAFDGFRRGFVLGFGAGPGVVFVPGAGSGNLPGLFTDFRIGVGLDDRTLLHYSGKQLWRWEEDLFFTDMFPSVAVTRYARAEGPSAFWTAGAG
jgi:hypothetical protein